ncbi:MAG: hypothetical protein ABIG39_01330 [Candidatus Micrarchaeota archaeon]
MGDETTLSKENIIDLVSAIMAAGVVINTSGHEEHVEATLRYYYRFKDLIRKKEGVD